MRYLSEKEISSYLHKSKTIQYFTGYLEFNKVPTITWVSIQVEDGEYLVLYHEVLSDDKEYDSVYNYPYAEPDDLYGKEIETFDNLDDTLEFLKEEFKCIGEKFFIEGQLDDVLKEFPNE